MNYDELQHYINWSYKQGLEDAAKLCDEQATDPDEADNKPWTGCAEYLAHSIRELGETE